MTKEISNVIYALRFPLMLGVVLEHCGVADIAAQRAKGMWVSASFIDLFLNHLSDPCVPLFFFISGYLFFFKNTDSFTMKDYGTKLNRRVHSLLIPYIFWNAVVLAYYAFMHKFTPSFIDPTNRNVYEFTAMDWIRSFWDEPGGKPTCFQLWFLRDLICAVVVTPVIYYIAKYGKWMLAALLSVAYIYCIVAGLLPYQIVFTYFTLGAICGVNNYDFVAFAKKVRIPATLLFVGCITYSLIWPTGILRGVITISGMLVYIYLATFVTKVNKTLSDSSFFIYAFHGTPLIVIIAVFGKILNPESQLMYILDYTLCFASVTALSIGLYIALKKLFPKLTSVICGGR